MKLRAVTFNTLFGGRDDDGLGADDRWSRQVPFLKSLEPDILLLQECNFWQLLGRRRLNQAVAELGLAAGFLAEANPTTAGHQFHSAILTSARVTVLAEDCDRGRYHHVMGWMNLRLPGPAGRVLEVRNLHLDPFDPRNRAREVAPLEVLAAPGRLALVGGDANTIGQRFPEPDWKVMAPHLLNSHLRMPGEAEVGDRDAVELLARSGFVDAAVTSGMADVPTAAFGHGDVPRRQDLILTSPALAPAVIGYQVHRQPAEDEMSDHCAVSVDLDLTVLA
ncbi:endonuclease/exonuclease/phosphatase family protein [Kitasatospora sp. NPDC051164]|uniref:endonuclease/exonuclease/phosphatase family protein n=1 Tax=Kitasatospora sp. NPDC051164 TaxID=3364055 RepID=UPI0037B478FD